MGQPLGRRRDIRVDDAIVAATREVLVEVGYAALTVDAVAARAGVGKAAIYRRHATKQEMVFAAAVHGLVPTSPPDTGSFEGDLAALAGDIVSSLTDPAAFAAVPGLFGDVAGDPALAARFHETFVAAERACVVEVVDRAVRRGRLRERPDPDVVHALLLGPIFTWLFLLRRGDDGELAATVAARVAGALSG
ncbi:TetR/AcrR family transcriptional regulator [Pseudonocardia nigra]|uniref:TetR/AcrR family transcriptional regulator n=1 Tax=Pseudonocardia nigra TaxID=1921578 RepID=UPI0027E22716|nr:TetR/AcrR family transcriptional regulator [Pseudonocardia nigra]